MADKKKHPRGGDDDDDDDSDARPSRRSSSATNLTEFVRSPDYPPPNFTKANVKPDSDIIRMFEDAKTQTQTLSSKLPPSTSTSTSTPKGNCNYTARLIGRLILTMVGGKRIQCSKAGIGVPGKLVHLVRDMSSDGALFILLVGNEAVFSTLALNGFHERFPCIMITGSTSGQPVFFEMMKTHLNLPILALLDCDPRGFKMLSLYGRGSRNINWIGITPTDLYKHNIPQVCRLPMTPRDINNAKSLLKDDFLNQNPEWRRQLDIMLQSEHKVEIEALCCFGFDYLTHVFLPIKFQHKDWL